MNLEDIHTLYSYNHWATARLLQATRLLSAPDFTRDLGSSHGSVRGTWVHALWAEWVWLERWRGASPQRPPFAEDEFPDLAAIEARWAELGRERRLFVADLTEDRLHARISYLNRLGERWEYALADMMQHVANHSSYHRGQVVTLLRQLGQVPPSTDFLLFFDEMAG